MYFFLSTCDISDLGSYMNCTDEFVAPPAGSQTHCLQFSVRLTRVSPPPAGCQTHCLQSSMRAMRFLPRREVRIDLST